jgi:hypothetical protein
LSDLTGISVNTIKLGGFTDIPVNGKIWGPYSYFGKCYKTEGLTDLSVDAITLGT